MRFRRFFTLFAVFAIGILFLLPSRLLAQTERVFGPVGVSFSVPQTFDPTQVIFTNVAPQSVPLSALLFPGLEVHSQVPGANFGFIRDIVSLKFDFLYDGAISINSLTTPGFDPWDVAASLTGNHHTLTFTRNLTGNAAPVNDNFDPGGPISDQSFANFWIADNTNQDFAAYIQLHPDFQATITPDTNGGLDRGAPNTNVTPEAGSVWLLLAGGLPLAGTLRARFRRTRR